MSALAEFESYVRGLSAKDMAELDQIIAADLKSAWLPNPDNIPQTTAYHSKADLMLYGGAAGSGKGLALDTPIPCPSGFVEIGNVKPGDTLFDERGAPCSVTAISDIQKRRC